MESFDVTCPSCDAIVTAPFSCNCESCGFSIDALAGRNTSQFQKNKWNEHTSLVSGVDIELDGKPFNASFDYNGVANIDDLVKYAVNYGSRATIQSNRGNHPTEVIVAYVPEIIGSGLGIFSANYLPCSGVCLMSPQSTQYGHSFPVLDQWVGSTFTSQMASCKL